MHPNQQCILAYQHNGKTLTQAHGCPIRAIVPGHAGARWVKWLNGLRISKTENDSPPMQLDYKILSVPEGISKGEEKKWKEKMMGDEKDDAFRKEEMNEKDPMQRLGMGGAIETPSDDDTIKGDTLTTRGYAVGQDGELHLSISMHLCLSYWIPQQAHQCP
jgi:sulfite oxidase